MKTCRASLFFLLLLQLSQIGQLALADITAERKLQGEFYIKGVQIAVTITIKGETGPITVVEQPPAGWNVKKILSGGVWSDGKITWNIPDFSGVKVLTYNIIPADDASQDVVFTGKVGDVEIGGMKTQYFPRPIPGKQAPMQTGLYYPYWLYLPTDYVQGDKKWPLMLFLHGSGEAGNTLIPVKTHGPPKLVDIPENQTKLPELFKCIVVSPQCPADSWWFNTPLHEVMDEILSKYAVDRNRIYVTGLSLGGFGTWSFASVYPDLVAAIMPLCGSGDAPKFGVSGSFGQETIQAAKLENLVKTPVWAFQGAKDTSVPLKYQKETVDKLLALGGNVKFTIYPKLEHDCWTVTYSNPEVFKWLLQQDKSAKASVSIWENFK